jgi:hypothetical protein
LYFDVSEGKYAQGNPNILANNDIIILKTASGYITWCAFETKSDYNSFINHEKVFYSYFAKPYLSENGYWRQYKNVIDNRTVTMFGLNGYIVIKSYAETTIKSQSRISDIATDLNVSVTTVNGVGYIPISSGLSLYFDISEGKYKQGTPSQMEPEDVLILKTANGYITWIAFDTLTEYNDFQAVKTIFNSPPLSNFTDWESYLQEYAKNFSGDIVMDNFMFFTDPHLMNSNETIDHNWFEPYFAYLAKVYNSGSFKFLLCGGDWLIINSTKNNALYKLSLCTGYMRSLCKNYYQVVGNHEYNCYSAGSDPLEHMLTDEEIKNVYLPDEDNLYYAFKTNNVKYLCINSGSMLPDVTVNVEQTRWFAEELLEDSNLYNTLVVHGWGVQSIACAAIAQAYNNKTSITYEGVVYDYSNTNGKVNYILAGHTHQDDATTQYGMPLIVTTQLRDDSYTGETFPTFDLVVADYTNGVVKMTRVGHGSDRTVNMLI